MATKKKSNIKDVKSEKDLTKAERRAVAYILGAVVASIAVREIINKFEPKRQTKKVKQ